MDIRYFGHRIAGPELDLEDMIASQLPDLFAVDDRPMWAGASMPLGAGKPDLIFVQYEPIVLALGETEIMDSHVLAYLRSVGKARAETISQQMRRSEGQVQKSLNSLLLAEAVREDSQVFSVMSNWKYILSEVTCIEAKISDWRRAVMQAIRNRVFAQRSFVALPYNIARRIRTENILSQHGIGVLGVKENGAIKIVRRARLNKPKAWSYYYQLATLIAQEKKEGEYAIFSPNRRCTKADPRV